MGEGFRGGSGEALPAEVKGPTLVNSFGAREKERVDEEYVKEKGKIESRCVGDRLELADGIDQEVDFEIIKGAENINELFETVVNQILKVYIGRLNTKEGVSLSPEGIYEDVVAILDSISKNLGEDNIFLNDISLVKQNFLEPKDKGVALIKKLIDKTILHDKDKVRTAEDKEDDYDVVVDTVKSSMLVLHDIARTKSPDELSAYIKEFKNIEQVKKIFEVYPDLANILVNILPRLLKTISKDEFSNALDNFFSGLKPDLLYFVDYAEREDKTLTDEDKEKVYDLSANTLKSGILFLHDIASTKTPEELSDYVKEFKNIGVLKELIRDFPDLENILVNIIPNILKSISKEDLEKALDNFLGAIKDDAMYIGDYIFGEESDEEKKRACLLNIINKGALFLGEINNIETADKITKGLQGLEIVKGNQTFTDIAVLLNNAKLSIENKHELNTLLLKFFEIYSRADFEDSDIDPWSNKMIILLNKIAKEVGTSKVKNILMQITGLDSDEETQTHSDISYDWGKIRDYLLVNRGEILKIAGSYVLTQCRKIPYFGELILGKEDEHFHAIDSKEDLVDYILESGFIDRAIEGVGGMITEKFREMVKIDLKKFLKDTRNELLDKIMTKRKSESSDEEPTETKPCIPEIETKEDILVSGIVGKIEAAIRELVASKFKSGENLNTEEIIDSAIVQLDGFLKENSDELFSYINSLGIKIEGKRDKRNILEIIESVLDNPKLRTIIGKILSRLQNRVTRSDNTVGELVDIIEEAKESNGLSLIKKENRKEITELGFDEAFNEILNDESKTRTLINIIEANYDLDFEITKDSLMKIIGLLRKYCEERKLSNLLKSNMDIFDSGKGVAKERILDIGKDIYNSIKDKDGFINALIDEGIIREETKKTRGKPGESIEFTNDKIDTFCEVLYSTLDSTPTRDLGKTVDKLFGEFSLSELRNIKILGKSLGENAVIILKGLEKGELKSILKDNRRGINKILKGNISENERTIILIALGLDIFEQLDVKGVQKELNPSGRDEIEFVGLDIADEFQQVLRDHEGEINRLSVKVYELYTIYESGREIKVRSREYNKIKQYGRDIFNVLHLLVNKLDKHYLHGKILDSGNGDSSEILDKFISSFISNNKAYSFGTLFRTVFKGKDFGASIEGYFLNSKNRDNFGVTIADFYVSLHAKETNRSLGNDFHGLYEG